VGQMLQIDRVSHISGNSAVCEIDLPGHWVFPMHFPKDPIFPGSLLVEAAGQAVAIFAWHAGFRGRPRLAKIAAKFESPVGPTDRQIRLVASVRQRRWVFLGSVDIFVSEREVARIEPTLIILPR